MPEVQRADVELRTTLRIAERTHDLWVVRGRLYRPVIGPDAVDASLEEIVDASTEALLERHDATGGKAFWRDHPSAIARAHWAPEEPHFSSDVGHEPSRFWQVDMDHRAPSQDALQAILATHLVMDDRLWRPTSAPGWKVSKSGLSVTRWLEGIGIDTVTSAYFDAGEEAAALRRANVRPKAASLSVEMEYALINGPKSADLHTLRLCLELISKESNGAVAGYGPRLARLYWMGRMALETRNTSEALQWLDAMVIELRSHENQKLVQLRELIEQRTAARFDFSVIR